MGVKLSLTPKTKNKDYERSKQDHEARIFSGPQWDSVIGEWKQIT